MQKTALIIGDGFAGCTAAAYMLKEKGFKVTLVEGSSLIGIETPSLKNKLYPYPIKSEISKADKYKNLGRMGIYHYDNMDIIVKDCIKLMKRV